MEEKNLIFEVEDDGIGLDLAKVSEGYAGRNSFGILNMRERAGLLGGKLSVRSPRSAGQGGTVVVGILPLRNILGEPSSDFNLF